MPVSEPTVDAISLAIGPVPPARFGADLRILGRALTLGWAWNTTVLGALALALATFPVGLGIAAALVLLVRLGAEMEREWLMGATGRPLDDALRPLPAGRWWRRAQVAWSDPAVWRALLYFTIAGPVAVLAIGFGALWVAAAILGTGAVVWLPSVDGSVFGLAFDSAAAVAMSTLAGIAAFAGFPRLPAATTAPSRWLALTLLGPDPDGIRLRADRIASHARLVERIAAEERRRVERNLHDGAQQHMVSAGMTLGLLIEQLERNDPLRTRRLAVEAREHIKTSIRELRALAQGIHPAALAEVGLRGALEGLAGTSPIPIDLAIRLNRPPGPTVEEAAYFVAAEATTNAIRHSRASRIAIDVGGSDDGLTVAVADDGRGGADRIPGGGLAGLADRVAAVGGTLRVESPEGGGTKVIAALPWSVAA